MSKSQTDSLSLSPASPILFDPVNCNDLNSIIANCTQNLNFLEQFLLKSKDAMAQRQAYQTAVQNVHAGLRHIAQKQTASAPAPAPQELMSTIADIVEKAIDRKLGAAPTIAEAPLPYSDILGTKTKPTTNIIKAPTAKIYKVIVKPGESHSHIKTADDTKKILMAKKPKDYQIKVNKITPLRGNSILLESSCASLLDLPKNQTLHSVDLIAESVSKSWPKIQIFDVPNDVDKDELIAEMQKDLPAHLQENIARNAFKIGKRSLQTATWVIEIKPEVRNHLIKTGKTYVRWLALNVKDYIRVTRCYNCQKFGHVSKHCKSAAQCGFCSADHATSNCQLKEEADKHKCANCIRSKVQNHKHTSGSSDCTIYKHRLQETINNTEYIYG